MAAFLDDRWYEHPKWELLEDDPRVWAEAFSLWAAANAYCKANKTGGRFTLKRLEKSTPLARARIKKAAKELCRVELWHADGPDAWHFHNWEKWSGKWEEGAETQREKGRERQQRYRDKKKAAEVANADGDAEDNASPLRHGDNHNAGSPLTSPNLTEPYRASSDRHTNLGVKIGFSKRYLAARGMTWPSGKYDRQTKDLDAWLRANPEADCCVMLDNFFGDSWAAERDFPFGLLAGSPGKYAAPPEPEDPEAKRRKVLAQREASMDEIRAQMRGGK